ncbi:unnamed protein product [Gordionus sp. m RMFG-2023]
MHLFEKNLFLKAFNKSPLYNDKIIIGLIRNRTRINDPKPRPSHFLRRKLEVATQPFYAPDNRPQYEKCSRKMRYNEDYHKHLEENIPFDLKEITFENFLAKQLRSFFDYPLISFFHVLPSPKGTMFHMRMYLRKNYFVFRKSNYLVAQKALIGTKFANIIPLFKMQTPMIIKKEMDLVGLGNIISLHKHLILLGGLLFGQYLSASQIEYLIKAKDQKTLVSTLLSNLSQPMHSITNNLNYQLTNLSHILSNITHK